MKTKPQFKKGQKVVWTSQANGTNKTKVGVIIEVVKPNTVPRQIGRPSAWGKPIWHGQPLGDPRKDYSYVVALLDAKGKPSKSQWRRYWPQTQKLRFYEGF